MTALPLLLDTCAALWTVEDNIPQSLSNALSESHRSGIPTFVSPITAWEIGLLAARGRFRSAYAPLNWFKRLVGLPNVRLADMSPEILLNSSLLPNAPPRDPAARIIIATAREHGYVVVTRDREILAYANDGHLRALAC